MVAEVERKKRAGHVKVLAHFYQSIDPRRGSGIMAELLGARSETEASKSDGIIRILSSFTRSAFLFVAMFLLATLCISVTPSLTGPVPPNNQKLRRSGPVEAVVRFCW